MATTHYQGRILVVENDPITSDLIVRQALRPLAYEVKTVRQASEAMNQIASFSPHIVILNLVLPDLSGKDLLVALSSQGINLPAILIAAKGMELDILHAFRLGASDYIFMPVRETEVVSAVERAFRTVNARIEREKLAHELQRANQKLQQRVRELTKIFAFGKAVTSVTSQQELFEKIIEGAIGVCKADRGWLLTRSERRKLFLLRAYRNLPGPLAAHVNKPLEDGISHLVALSGEALSIHGEALSRLKIARLGQAALVVPIKAQEEVIGLLVVLRKKPVPFSKNDLSLLKAVADYASISLANARLFRALEERASHSAMAIERTSK
jgi:DNA-binding response OmpR family regulator